MSENPQNVKAKLENKVKIPFLSESPFTNTVSRKLGGGPRLPVIQSVIAQWESVLVVGGQQFAQIGNYFKKPSFVNISLKTPSIQNM